MGATTHLLNLNPQNIYAKKSKLQPRNFAPVVYGIYLLGKVFSFYIITLENLFNPLCPKTERVKLQQRTEGVNPHPGHWHQHHHKH